MVSDRKGIAFYLPETRILLDELPDDFFDLSQSEAKMLYQEFVQKRKELDDKPMITASMRELQQSRKMREFLDKYKYCIVRVQFADRSVLQGIFQPNEAFSEVNNFVKSHLREDLQEFFLFTTPPKVIPDPESTLLDLKFVPGVKLYFGTPHTQVSTFLKEDILTNIRSPEIAAKEAQKYRMTKVVNEEDEVKDAKVTEKNGSEVCCCSNGKQATTAAATTTDEGEEKELRRTPTVAVAGPSEERQARATSSSSTSSQNKVPKWFKPNKK